MPLPIEQDIIVKGVPLRDPSRRRIRSAAFPAPAKGIVEDVNVSRAPKDAAQVLENLFPTLDSARLRGGAELVADSGGAPIVSLFNLAIGNDRLFAGVGPSTQGGSDGFVEVAAGIASAADAPITGLRGADWSTTHISTAGGDFLVGVNGVDEGFVMTATDAKRYWHGTDAAWNAMSESDRGDLHRMHGISTKKLSRVWNFKERLYFVEEGGMSAWYLAPKAFKDTDSARIAELPLGALFERGGSLLFGTTFSMDSGDGLDDHCVFVTDRGEVAVFGGLHPGASDWRMEGRYVIGDPLNANAFFHVGGDLAICTGDGIVSLTSIARGDRVKARAEALTKPIGDTWRDATAERGSFPFNATLWRDRAMLAVGVTPAGNKRRVLVMNAETGAWCVYTGWDFRCSCVSADKLYFGTGDGRVAKAETGGNDLGEQYAGLWVPKFQSLGQSGRKFAVSLRMTYRAGGGQAYTAIGLSDHQVESPADLPDPLSAGAGGSSAWGSATGGAAVSWGREADGGSGAVWGSSDPPASNREEVRAIRAIGQTLSVAVEVASNSGPKPTFEIREAELHYELGYGV